MEFTYNGLVRWSFGFQNPNHAAALFAMLLPFVWLFRGEARKGALRILAICIESVLYAMILLTMSRAGIMAVVMSRIFFSALKWRLAGKRPDLKRGAVLGFILAVVIVLLAAAGYSDSLGRFREWIAGGDKAVSHRYVLWEGALRMIAENPFGTGAGLSGKIWTEFYQPDGMDLRFRTMVNSFLTFIAERGLLIALLMAIPPTILVMSALRNMFSGSVPEKTKVLLISAVSSLFASLVSGMFSTCFEFAAFANVFSRSGVRGMTFLNIAMSFVLNLALLGLVFLLVWLVLKRKLLAKRDAYRGAAIAAMGMLVLYLSACLADMGRGERCRIFTSDGKPFAAVSRKKCSGGKILVVPDENVLRARRTLDFFLDKHKPSEIIMPLGSFAIADGIPCLCGTVVLCGGNCRMEISPEIETKSLIYFLPDSPPFESGGDVRSVYLPVYDRHGWNRAWKAKFPGKTRLCDGF